jgi:hypothetical protein
VAQLIALLDQEVVNDTLCPSTETSLISVRQLFIMKCMLQSGSCCFQPTLSLTSGFHCGFSITVQQEAGVYKPDAAGMYEALMTAMSTVSSELHRQGQQTQGYIFC